MFKELKVLERRITCLCFLVDQRGGQAAPTRIISFCILETIKNAYSLMGLPHPQEVRAHSARGISTSWASYAKGSTDTICKTATWKTPTTFIRHYRFFRTQILNSEPQFYVQL
ncbi:TPA: hypothetical protein GDO54_018527 [Pyxicephalus adspersus]|uniref:Uncharacterized protein n=1 Tax=Pyxicephalus adspersus TaxID=30357 RepID=A0AAV2ZJ61_PYXAD|nr:TPA: hypothetical protein GDO54_018527 [Pyxicephalus adspersus]